MQTPKYYYFTRGTLASELIASGVNVERTGNIYDPTRTSWKAEFSPMLCRIVKEYCAERNISTPAIILEVEKQFDMKGIL